MTTYKNPGCGCSIKPYCAIHDNDMPSLLFKAVTEAATKICIGHCKRRHDKPTLHSNACKTIQDAITGRCYADQAPA